MGEGLEVRNDQVAAALTSHGLAAWQIPRGAQSGRQMTKVMKDFCASQESKETYLKPVVIMSTLEASHFYFSKSIDHH